MYMSKGGPFCKCIYSTIMPHLPKPVIQSIVNIPLWEYCNASSDKLFQN